jgi:hypothetical protein
VAAPVFVTDEVVTAAKMNLLPKGVLGYAEVTANQVTISTVTDLTGLSVTVSVASGHRIKITAGGDTSITDTAGVALAQIKESGTVLGRWARWEARSTNQQMSSQRSVVLAPSVGSHTYKLTLERAAGTGTVGLVAGAGNPAFILVEDIGTL